MTDERTLDIHDEPRAWSQAQSEQARAIPRVTVLYHGDLRRIGATTQAQALEGGQWVVFGRLKPLLVTPWDGQQAPQPLADPYLSRQQAALRWVAHRACFEVRPAENARRPVSVVEHGPGGVRLNTLEAQRELPPGTVLAIGERVLLLLDYAPPRDAQHQRLGMIGETRQLWALRQDIQASARFARPVLILGETGAGKELIARAVHAAGDRAQGPFVAVNCAALPSHLVESILFGHKKGAFTGATDSSPGLLREAEGGTLFLDELGELPMDLQAKLLRVLQEGVYTPVGERGQRQADVRVVAATHRDPQEEIQSGRLRSDLYYRLAAHTILAPSLRERRWDVPLLLSHFLRGFMKELPELGWLSPDPLPAHLPIPLDFVVKLIHHPWPGNVRELQNVVEQTARLNLHPGPFREPALPQVASGPATLEVQAPARGLEGAAPDTEQALGLPAGLGPRAARKLGLKQKTLHRLLGCGEPPTFSGSEDVHEQVEVIREQLADNLFSLLAQAEFNQVHVAEELGMARSTLIRLMDRFGLPRPQDLEMATIERVAEQTGGDLETSARLLRVSPAGLRLRLSKEGRDALMQ